MLNSWKINRLPRRFMFISTVGYKKTNKINNGRIHIKNYKKFNKFYRISSVKKFYQKLSRKITKKIRRRNNLLSNLFKY